MEDVRHVSFVAFVLPLCCRSLSDAFPHVVRTSNPPTSFQPKKMQAEASTDMFKVLQNAG
jgi:hypothetical protein